MPKTDWQALDGRIAREIMFCVKWDELSEKIRKAYWVLMDEEPADWTLAYNRGKWWFLDESGRADWEYSIEDWQPHLKVAQALTAKDKIVAQGWHFDLKIEPPVAAGEPDVGFPLTVAQFWQFMPYRYAGARAHTDVPAICLALEAWMDAQKETQSDPG